MFLLTIINVTVLRSLEKSCDMTAIATTSPTCDWRTERTCLHERRAIEQAARVAARRFLRCAREYGGVSMDAEDVRHLASEIACEHADVTSYAHWSIPQAIKWFVLAFCTTYQSGDATTEKLHPVSLFSRYRSVFKGVIP